MGFHIYLFKKVLIKRVHVHTILEKIYAKSST